VAFNGLGITCADYLKKGRQIAVEGQLRSSGWTTDDGSRRSKLEVIARRVDFLDRPATKEDQSEPF